MGRFLRPLVMIVPDSFDQRRSIFIISSARFTHGHSVVLRQVGWDETCDTLSARFERMMKRVQRRFHIYPALAD